MNHWDCFVPTYGGVCPSGALEAWLRHLAAATGYKNREEAGFQKATAKLELAITGSAVKRRRATRGETTMTRADGYAVRARFCTSNSNPEYD